MCEVPNGILGVVARHSEVEEKRAAACLLVLSLLFTPIPAPPSLPFPLQAHSPVSFVSSNLVFSLDHKMNDQKFILFMNIQQDFLFFLLFLYFYYYF